jgi:hypothetical protein
MTKTPSYFSLVIVIDELLLALASTVILGSESHGIHDWPLLVLIIQPPVRQKRNTISSSSSIVVSHVRCCRNMFTEPLFYNGSCIIMFLPSFCLAMAASFRHLVTLSLLTPARPKYPIGIPQFILPLHNVLSPISRVLQKIQLLTLQSPALGSY